MGKTAAGVSESTINISVDSPNGLTLTHYKVMLLATLVVGLVGLLTVVAWVFVYRGGLAWSSQPSLQFNWHVLVMTLAMVYFVAFELMIFRVLRYGPKKRLKLIHAGFFVMNVSLLVIGYWSIIDVHWGRSHFFSLHSWLAILTTLLFLTQGVLGFVFFLWPGAQLYLRRVYMPYHVFFGLTLFVMGVTTTLLGLFEEIKKIPKFTGEAIMMNTGGLLIVLFTVMVIFLQTRPSFRREPLPDD